MKHYLSRQAEAMIRQSREIARQYGLGYVGTEHLLLAIVQEGANLGAEVLRVAGANEYVVQARVDEMIQQRAQETWVIGRLPGTPHYKDVLSKAAEEARGTGNWQIQPEHMVLGLLKEPNSLGYKVLESLGVTLAGYRSELTRQKKSGGQPVIAASGGTRHRSSGAPGRR